MLSQSHPEEAVEMLGGSRLRALPNHVRMTVLVGVTMLALAACDRSTNTSVSSPSIPSSVSSTPTVTISPSPQPASWARMASIPTQADYYAPVAAVWDGQEMLVVETQSHPWTYCVEMLYAYDPATDVWQTLSKVPTPKGCFEGSDKAVWTGKELLLWGIANAAYNPSTDAWRPLPEPPAGAGGPSVVVWTGSQMIGWGGGCCDQELADGAAYTPATNTWRMLPPSPLSGRHAAGAWTGTEMIIAGGEGYASGQNRPSSMPRNVHFADAAAYNPTTRRWRKLPSMPIRRGGGYYTATYAAVWDGSKLIVIGGTRTGSARPIPRGVAYDPSGDRWRWLAPIRFPRTGFVAAWVGDQLIVWGGVGEGGTIPPSGESYDPATNTWSALPIAPLRARVAAAGVWTGTRLLIFGGNDARSLDSQHVKALNDGAVLTPG